MMTKLNIFCGLLLLISISVNAQGKYTANKYFNDFAYKKSAELYKNIYEKGDSTQLVLERLGDSYYFNMKTREAEQWYSKLVKRFELDINPEYLFRYAQVLKSNGKYSESDAIMLKFKSIKPNDSRVNSLESFPNYLSAFGNREENELILLHNVSTNTEFSDYGSFVQGEVFFFSSSRPNTVNGDKIYARNNQPFFDIYQSNIYKQDLDDELESQVLELKDVSMISGTINTSIHESSAVITKDGQVMYFTRNNYKNGKIGKSGERESLLKLYKAVLIDGVWSRIEELPFNSDEYSIGHPALSPDEKTLYFTSDMPGGLGYTDIYKVSIEEYSYGKPKNLGSLINTEGREMFPFVSSENELYFSSDGHLGLGALDIFKSTLLEDGRYSSPKNIKAPFNSPKDDFAFYINAENTEGFIASNREGGKGDDDVYSFIIDRNIVCTIKGSVTSTKTNAVLANVTVKLLDTDGLVLKETTTDTSGYYVFEEVPCEAVYRVNGEKEDFLSDIEDVIVGLDSSKKTGSNAYVVDLLLEPLIERDQIVINSISFEFNKADITPEAEYELEKIVSVMINHPDMVIKIESHTDSRGSKSYNRSLSDRRAKSTRDYIVSRGIAADRIESAIGYGEDQLLNHCDDANSKNCTEEEHQLNRRTYFKIVSGGNSVKVQWQ